MASNTLSNDPRGSFFRLESLIERQKDGIQFQRSPKSAMVVCLSKPDKYHNVKVAQVTRHNTVKNIKFIPIASLPQNNYPFRWEIRNANNQGQDSTLLESSYLRLEPFMVPFEMLEVAVGTRRVEKDGVTVRKWVSEDRWSLEPDSLAKVLELLSILETRVLFVSALGLELQDLAL